MMVLRAEAEVLLSPRGCPACRFAAEATERFFGWFAAETHAQESMRQRLRKALGMCPRHTRVLLTQELADGMLTSVYRDVFATAGPRVAGTMERGRCPACQNRAWAVHHAIHLVRGATRDPGLRRLYRAGGGLCVEHLLTALRERGPSEGHRLVGLACATSCPVRAPRAPRWTA